MTDELTRLDGNAAAGPLSRFFAFEATNLQITCASCGKESVLGKLPLYGGTMGMILRCSRCGEVILRALEVGPSLRLDFRGAACLALGPEPTRSAR
jgi:ribosomal protein S27E